MGRIVSFYMKKLKQNTTLTNINHLNYSSLTNGS